MSYGMDGWNHDNDLVRRKDVMDSLAKEYNDRRAWKTGGLQLAWIEKAVNDAPSAQPTQNTRVNSNNALDTISRAAAIEAIDEINAEVEDGYGFDYAKWRVHFRVLPSAQPTDADIQKMQDIEQAMLDKAFECGRQDAVQWIPCSKRLPFDAGYYLTTTTYNEVFCDYWNLNEWNRTEQVIAWMPLPEPAKLGGD